MVIRVTLKDPDTMHDAVDEALKRQAKPSVMTDREWQVVQEMRAEEIKAAISSKWMEYGEYLTVDFVVSAEGEAEAATVIENGK
jgi:hypothetical protein